ncbi:Altered inheritance of mitochondria protein 9, mitochondrial [Rhizoctonia solani]|uniref:Altered inheritance of mitochondria protein 9, mitochondrial n=1 Tax=Rhizoctonia solani TaxID=456999 RepID=A0A8H7HEQ0_9AGAM|nr:Altered inheritance of mitochondria protein 9, mitochondrial [Rhizoctonia solani]
MHPLRAVPNMEGRVASAKTDPETGSRQPQRRYMVDDLPNLFVLLLAVIVPLILWQYRSLRAKCVLSLAQCEEFFEYTSGRWLYNEDKQLALRYVRFNVDALQQIAAAAIGASYCTSITKTHEGSYNKIFRLKFDNNREIIAKIPTKLIPPFYTTASEVATMDYVRTVLKIPVPEVLAYSARADSTPVGTEFILMRPGSGSELRKRWDSMSEMDAKAVIDYVLRAESQFASYQFSQIGSIYYVEDVEPALRQRPLYRDGSGPHEGADRFRIGPSTEWALWRGARAELQVHHGPWPDVKSYIEGIVRIHQAWLSSHARQHKVQVPPRSPEDLDPKAHQQLLEKLVSLSSQLEVLPDLQANVLWHKDLHARNIMVDKSSPPSIQLIDWQSTSVGPVFQQATFAIFAQYHGDPRIKLHNNARLPDDFDSLPWHEKIYLRHQHRLALRHLYYCSGVEPRSLNAQQWVRDTRLRSAIDEASRTWDLGLGPFRQHLSVLAIAAGVEESTGSFIDSDNQDRIQVYHDKVSRLYKELGIEGDGWVSSEDYEDIHTLNQQRMEDWDEMAAGGPYPITDGAPSWFVT